MDAEQLAAWLEQQLPSHVHLDLNRSDLRVQHVLNWGGFVNHSFTVVADAAKYHLKITNDVDNILKLRRWLAVHELLAARYRAPKVFEWVELPEIGFAGLLFEHLAGHTATLHGKPDLVAQLLALADRLHRDEDLARHLHEPGAHKTCADHFLETYIERFHADLEAVASAPPPFVSPALLQKMQHETDHLANTVRDLHAFQQPATNPVHGDLHEGNILMTADSWNVLDWDDLALGDPAIDLAILLWPIVWTGGNWRDSISNLEASLAERIEFCLRAQLLDEVIDSLADYTEAPVVPSRQAEVQSAKRQRHEEALARYARNWWK